LNRVGSLTVKTVTLAAAHFREACKHQFGGPVLKSWDKKKAQFY
jgi:hypothetical protein